MTTPTEEKDMAGESTIDKVVSDIENQLGVIDQKLQGYQETLQERERLQAALDALQGRGIHTPAPSPARNGGTRRDLQGDTQKVLRDKGKPMGASDIAREMGLPDAKGLYSTLKTLVERGALKKSAKGEYELAK